MSFVAAAGLAVGIGGAVVKGIKRNKANKKLEQLQKEDPIYTENPEAQQRLSLAKSLLNARMPGAARAERNIYASGANSYANVQRNATDSSQALALGAGILGQQSQQFNQLGQDEAQDYQRRYSNVSGAQQGVINEQDKVYQDQVRRFGDKTQIQGAQSQNTQNTWSDISNGGFAIADFSLMNPGLMSGFGGTGQTDMYKKKRIISDPQLLPYN